MSDTRKIFRITITIAELMRHISKWSYTVGENMPDDQAKARHFVQGATDRGHDALLKDALDMAWVDVQDTVSAYLDDHLCQCDCDYCSEHHDVCDCTCDSCVGIDESELDEEVEDTEAWQDYRMVLYFPANVYPDLGRRVAIAAKRYMLSKARSEWEYLTNRDNGKSESEALQAKNRLRVTIQSRMGGVGKRTTGTWDNIITW